MKLKHNGRLYETTNEFTIGQMLKHGAVEVRGAISAEEPKKEVPKGGAKSEEPKKGA